MIEEAAELAANEALEEIDTDEAFEDDGIEVNFEPSEVSIDVFEEGFRKAVAAKDAPRYYIKKNSQFLTVKDYPYSWEQLQKEYGPGWYQVQCKARSNGRILKGQTEMVGDPNEGRYNEAQEDHVDSSDSDKNLAILGWLQTNQERAELRAREQAKSTENGLASVMQAVMVAQQEASKNMMQMMMESSKQSQNLFMAMMNNQNQSKGPDPLLTLLSTLITQQGKSGEGFTSASVIKMIQDAETRAEQRTTKNFEWLEKKSNELAEIKAEAMIGNEEHEESLTKSLLKGFVPVLSQMVAQQGQTQGQVPGQPQMMNPQQQAALQAARQEQMVQASLRPGIPGNMRPQVPTRAANVPQGTVQAKAPAQKIVVQEVQVQKPVLDDQQKEIVLKFVGSDIAQAMISGSNASTTAEQLLMKLEKEGVSRQTIANGFTLEDFYGFAEKYIPQESLSEAKVWLKGLFDAIQGLAVPTKLKTAANGGDTANKEAAVPAKRNTTGTGRARTQPESNPTNI